MRLAPLLALCLAVPLAAQIPDPTPPESYYPLGIGDIREYRTTTSSPPRPPSYLRESVVGDMEVDGQTYHLVDAVEYNVSGAETSRRTRLLRFDSTLAVPVEREANGFENPVTPCRLDLPFGPLGSNDDCPFYSGSPSEAILGVQTPVKTFISLIGGVRYAAGFGFVSAYIDEAGTESETRLHYARIDGVTYGYPDPILPPLPGEGIPDPTPPADYVPLGVGNRWEYSTLEHAATPDRYYRMEVLSDTLVGGMDYVVVRTQSYSSLNAPPIFATTEVVRFDSTMAQVVRPNGDGARYLFGGPPCRLDLPFAPAGTIPNCSGFKGGPPLAEGFPDGPNARKRFSTGLGYAWTFEEGIGLVRYELDLQEPYDLRYSRVAGVEYGSPIEGLPPYVAGENTPTVATLTLRVAPTPTAGPVTLAVVGAASPADVEVFDALGRRVWRGSVAGETTVDASGWAPGVYVVRATAGGATTVSRFVRR